jgi:hypothetical protein
MHGGRISNSEKFRFMRLELRPLILRILQCYRSRWRLLALLAYPRGGDQDAEGLQRRKTGRKTTGGWSFNFHDK